MEDEVREQIKSVLTSGGYLKTSYDSGEYKDAVEEKLDKIMIIVKIWIKAGELSGYNKAIDKLKEKITVEKIHNIIKPKSKDFELVYTDRQAEKIVNYLLGGE